LKIKPVYQYTGFMPRVSKNKLTEKQLYEISDMFLNLISQLTVKNDVEDFLDNFLTPEEKVMLAKRLMVFIMIVSGYQTEDIKSTLHVSHETIRIYKNELLHKSTLFRTRIKKLSRQQEVGQLLAKINKLLKPIELMLQSKTNMKARAKLYNLDFD